MCEIVGSYKMVKTEGREVFRGLIEDGLGEYSYQLYADTDFAVFIDCNRNHPSSEINHSCNPNTEIEEVSVNLLCIR